MMISLFKILAGALWRGAHWLLPMAAVLTIFSSVFNVIAPTFYHYGDNSHHMLAEYALAYSFRAGDNLFGPLPLDFGISLLRFYQPLFYLNNVVWHLLTDWDLRTTHMAVMGLCLTLSPLSYCYAFKKIGLPRFAAGFAGMVAPLSVAGFGNSFEAFFSLGVSTQAMGSFFFPLFIGGFAGLLRGENRATSTSLLFALACLSHAMMTVYSVFVGALYFLVTNTSLRANWKRLAAFGVLGVLLISFWLIPFLEHTMQSRPVPDSVFRGHSKRWWFTGLSDKEMVEAAISGRLFDDPSVPKVDQTDPLDKKIDQINMAGTRFIREPILTPLLGLGLLVGLFGFRKSHSRFLVAGLAFSLLLLAGPDDHPWLRRIPFMGHIQSFRCTYIVEFFAFGLIGLGLEAIPRTLWKLSRLGGKPVGVVAAVIMVVFTAGVSAVVLDEIDTLGDNHVVINDAEPRKLHALEDSTSVLDRKGYPFRFHSQDKSQVNKDWLGTRGLRMDSTHWGSIGPSLSLVAAIQSRSHPKNNAMRSLLGVRYVAGNKAAVKKLIDAKDPNGNPLFSRVTNGSDRYGRNNGRYYILDTGAENFLVPLAGRPLPVVCSPAQWAWLVKSWINEYGGRLFSRDTPIPLWVKDGSLSSSGLLEHAEMVLYLRQDSFDRDRQALIEYKTGGGHPVTTFEADGLATHVLSSKQRVWKYVNSRYKRSHVKPATGHKSVHLNPAMDLATVNAILPPTNTSQRYVFEVEALEPLVIILPTQAVDGWSATVSGKPLEIFPAGPDMTGAVVPAGVHRIEYVWSMTTVEKITMAAMFVALFFVLVFWLLGTVGRVYLALSLGRTLKRRKEVVTDGA